MISRLIYFEPSRSFYALPYCRKDLFLSVSLHGPENLRICFCGSSQYEPPAFTLPLMCFAPLIVRAIVPFFSLMKGLSSWEPLCVTTLILKGIQLFDIQRTVPPFFFSGYLSVPYRSALFFPVVDCILSQALLFVNTLFPN